VVWPIFDQSSKSKTPSSNELQSSKLQKLTMAVFEIGDWSFFGIWSLELGASQ
jgi:hypothetical protein